VTTHTFETELWLPVPREKVFPFFADARNLEVITPPWLNFTVLTPGEIPMRAGAIIDYKLRIHGLPVRWRMETAVQILRRTASRAVSPLDAPAHV